MFVAFGVGEDVLEVELFALEPLVEAVGTVVGVESAAAEDGVIDAFVDGVDPAGFGGRGLLALGDFLDGIGLDPADVSLYERSATPEAGEELGIGIDGRNMEIVFPCVGEVEGGAEVQVALNGFLLNPIERALGK